MSDIVYSIYYTTADGTIVASNAIPEAFASFQVIPDGCSQLALESSPGIFTVLSSTNYVDNGVLTAKATMSLTTNKTTFTANGTDEVTITGIPNGSVVTISGAVSATETITDGELIITSNVTGTILVSITNNPQYLPWSITLDAS